MIGRALCQYRVLEKIGAGGMAEVYRATDTRLGREVALKVLPAGTLADESARRADDRVPITAQLIDVASERHLWAEGYERDLCDVLALQSGIAEERARSSGRSAGARVAPAAPAGGLHDG